jgi:hypothetical protein
MYVVSAVACPPQPFSSFVVVLVLDFLGHGKRTDCQQRSTIENEDEDEDDWGGKLYRLKSLDRAEHGKSVSAPGKSDEFFR